MATPTSDARMAELSERHGDSIRAILDARFGRFSPVEGTTESVLQEREYDVFDAVVAFDRCYGGLELAGEERCFDGSPITESWSVDTAPAWLFGGAACLASGAHGRPRGDSEFQEFYGNTLGLVPVAYGPQDDIWFLDRVGRGYLQDTIGDISGPHCVASDPHQLFARIIVQLWCLKRLGARKDGSFGAALAAKLDLKPIPSATDESERWWGAGLTIAGERISLPGEGYPVRHMTWVGTPDKDSLTAAKRAMRR